MSKKLIGHFDLHNHSTEDVIAEILDIMDAEGILEDHDMLPLLPDILHKRQDEWHFSETEHWKPVANPDASDEVRQAICDFLAELEVS
ncbi:MAG: hypothetical protein IJC88_05430 [Oscillospiraceae bacterium]|nr:hypothetical protein [Oscillospiraceae bacterium]